MTKTFAERCHIAQQFLPDAQYKAMLTALHTEMLAALAEQPAPSAQQEPMTTKEIREWWASDNGLEDCDMAKVDDFEQVVRAIEAKRKEKNT